jgi:hypothetical protein
MAGTRPAMTSVLCTKQKRRLKKAALAVAINASG